MSDMKEAAVQIRVNADGKVTLSIDETLRRSVITAYSQAFCGAFDAWTSSCRTRNTGQDPLS